jgi:hypothetical protein
MRAVWILLVAAVAQGDELDRIRGGLYRVDAEAHVVRLHPYQAWDRAQAAQREADEVVDRLQKMKLFPEAAALHREAAELAEAARREEPEDVRTHAARLEILVRSLDDRLPAHDIAR